jgi:hypothetical protein
MREEDRVKPHSYNKSQVSLDELLPCAGPARYAGRRDKAVSLFFA